MARKDNKRKKRILNLAIIFTFTAIVFGSATYAWFIGMRTVNVNPFEVEIAATRDLELSLDGIHWSSTVSINKDNYMNPNASDATKNNRTDSSNLYKTNTNNWAGRGLIPVSTVGEIDATANRMKLYEKGSLTATKGGYRLMSSRVPNYAAGSNPDGYVVFDLFIRNSSGTEYYPDYNELNEEAIYLTNDSRVKVGSTGVADAGIENSVRVAFAQIGRVKAPTTTETQANPTVVTDPSIANIQGLTCNGSMGTQVDVTNRYDDLQAAEPTGLSTIKSTGICRTATIWEPNDTDHVTNALTWYKTTCMERTGANTSLAASYNVDTSSNPNTTCNNVVNGLAYHTYAIGKEITSPNAVDVYDGTDYNKYTADIASAYNEVINTSIPGASEGDDPIDTSGKYLFPVPYFTDTMKLKTGVERPQFMSLAPNSVTKVRVYIYLEGQDIDNYDFASIGKQISVKFGFTKERFTEDDINYNGPDLNQGAGPITGDTPADRRANIIAAANLGENPTEAQIKAALKAVDHTAPVIHFAEGTSQNMTVAQGGTFTAPTVSSVSDNVSTIATSAVVQSGVVNTQVPGKYRILYEVEDEAGNLATEVVAVEVTASQQAQP